MEKRNGEWRIAYRDVVYDAFAEIDAPADWSKPVFGLDFGSHRGPGDISHRLFAGTLT